MKNIFIEKGEGKIENITLGDFLFFPDRRIEEVVNAETKGIYTHRILVNTSKKNFNQFPYIRQTVFYELGEDKLITSVVGGEIIESIPCKSDPQLSRFERNLNDMGIILGAGYK